MDATVLVVDDEYRMRKLVGDFLRNDAGFPRTGTGQYQQGSVQVLDGGALLWVESVHVRNEGREK